MNTIFLPLATFCFAAAALASDQGAFIGKIVVEWVDSDRAQPKLKLAEAFGFEDTSGKTWVVPKGHILDGAAIPRSFRSLVGPPFGGKYRKASVLHDYFSSAKAKPWKDVHRMFYAASTAAGIGEAEAKIMYMAIYAEAPRWEPKEGSRCYRSCHAAAAALTWKPFTGADLRPVVDWIERDNPSLDEIEERVNAVTLKPGPHLFAQGH